MILVSRVPSSRHCSRERSQERLASPRKLSQMLLPFRSLGSTRFCPPARRNAVVFRVVSLFFVAAHGLGGELWLRCSGALTRYFTLEERTDCGACCVASREYPFPRLDGVRYLITINPCSMIAQKQEVWRPRHVCAHRSRSLGHSGGFRRRPAHLERNTPSTNLPSSRVPMATLTRAKHRTGHHL